MSLLFGIMITFKISFILAFSLKDDKLGKKTQNKKGKGNKGKDKKSKKNEKKSKKPPSTPVEKPKHIFEINKIIGVAHIEYELVPKIKYQIDVVCWGPIAKIFTNDGQKSFKTIVQNEIAWVPVYIEHYLENLPTEELKKYREYVVEFKFFNNIRKLGKMAKSDKTKKFYAYANEAESENLVEVYNEDPNLVEKTPEQLSKEAVESIMKDIILQCANGPKDEFVSWLHFPDNYDNFYGIIKKKCEGSEIECKDFVLPCGLPLELIEKKIAKIKDKPSGKDKKEKKGKKEKKDKKGKKQKPKEDTVSISVPAEVFFTDPVLATYKAENNSGIIKHVFIQFSVTHLITRAQKFLLNPLVVKIKKLSNFPVDMLTDTGISSIYVTYSIPYIAHCSSIEKPLVKTIKFNEAHIHFNESVSIVKLIQFIQTQKLMLQVYGTKKLAPLKPQAGLFGSEIDDDSISKIIPVHYHQKENSQNTSELLAVCTYDISSLIDNIWDFKEKGQCHVPGLTLFQKSIESYDVFSYTDLETVNEININSEYFKKKELIPEEILLRFCTALQVEVYLLAPQVAALVLHQIPNTFKRLLFILYSFDYAKIIYDDIRKQNRSVYMEQIKKAENNLAVSDIITGFMIDNGNNFIIFAEGLSTGFILNIWHLIDNCETEDAKVFFNTDILYEKRLYCQFLDVGIYPITLKIPLPQILSKHHLYLRQNVPLPCMEALKKLCLICHSSSYASVLQYNLLPKPMELISFNVEWGVPLHLKKADRKQSEL